MATTGPSNGNGKHRGVAAAEVSPPQTPRIPAKETLRVMEEHGYKVSAWWTSGRTGLAKSDSAPNAIHFTAPTEFGGLEGRWTPEELLLAAIAGCYTTTLRAIAGTARFNFTDLQVEASGTIRKAESGYSFTEIVLRPNLKIATAEERERALDLLTRAEKLCLVSRALGTPLKFEPQLEVAKVAPAV